MCKIVLNSRHSLCPLLLSLYCNWSSMGNLLHVTSNGTENILTIFCHRAIFAFSLPWNFQLGSKYKWQFIMFQHIYWFVSSLGTTRTHNNTAALVLQALPIQLLTPKVRLWNFLLNKRLTTSETIFACCWLYQVYTVFPSSGHWLKANACTEQHLPCTPDDEE